MNASLSEDSVAETALSKKNSDGKQRLYTYNSTYKCCKLKFLKFIIDVQQN